MHKQWGLNHWFFYLKTWDIVIEERNMIYSIVIVGLIVGGVTIISLGYLRMKKRTTPE